MFKISLIIVLLSLGTSSVWGQNSNFSTNINSQCPGNLFTLTADDNTMSTYLWTIAEQGGGSSTYNVNPVAFVLDNAANYDITLTVTDGGTSSTTTEIGFLEVFSNPIVDYTVTSAPYCAPATVDFTSISLAGSGTITSYVAFTDGTPYTTADFQHTYATTGSYAVNVSIENSNGCVASEDLPNIVVSDFPSLTSPLNPNTICSGTSFNYTPTSSIAGSTFSWVRLANPDVAEAPTSGVGNISEVLTTVSTANESVIYEVTTTSPGGCETTQNVVLTIQAVPVVTVNNADLCSGQTTTLTATPSQSGGIYSWVPSGSTQTINVNAPGTYSVSYSIGSCASSAVDALVTEIASPSITGISVTENSGLASDDGIMCKGTDIVTLTATASAASGTFTWTPGGTGNSIDVSPNSTTVYVVEYEENGCVSDPFSQTITVFSAPSNAYISTITNSCSSPITTEYSSTSSGTLTWSFPGGVPNSGAGSGPISIDYSSSGIYDIQMTNVSAQGCETVTDFPAAMVIGNGFPPTSNFTTTTPAEQCLDGNNFCFDYTGNGADTVEWDFGDGSPLELHDQNDIVCHSYSALGSYTVTMVPYTTVGSVLGCSGSPSSLTFEVLGPISAFSVSPLDCENQLTRTFTSTSTGISPTTQYTWDLVNPNSQITGVTSTTHTFSSYSPSYTSPYIITLSVEDPATGCPATVSTQNILAFPNDQASFESYTDFGQTTQTSEVCLGDELVFFNTTPLPQNTNPSTNSQDTQWDWTTANGTTWFTSSEYRGSPEDLTYSDQATSTSGNIPWQPGVYTVAMRNRANNNGTYCYDTVYNNITVHGIVGGFTVPDTVCVGEIFDVIDNSTAPLTSIISRDWDWESDGTIDLAGNVQITTHSFALPGVYIISMTAEDDFGCPKTFTQTIVVREILASFSVNRSFICDDEEVTITNNNSISFGTPIYDWSASTAVSPATPGTSSAFNPGTFLFDQTGVGSISLTVTDNLGCTDDTTMQIDVFDVFAAATGTPNSSSCFNPPTVVTFSNLSGNNVDPSSYQWHFGNGETSTEANPSTIYSLPGTFEVSLVVSSLTGGCSDSSVVELIDIGGPFGSISVSNTVLEGCSCYEAQIDVTTSDVADATLLFGDGSFENLTINTTETITHQYCNSGTTSQNLTPILFISSGTCNGNIPAGETITIHPIPNVVNPGDFEYCEGEATAPILLSGSVPATVFDWTNDNTSIGLSDPGVGNIASFTAATPGGPNNIANITITPTVNATGCSGTPETFSITIKNTTTVDAGGPTDVICAGTDVTLNGSFGGGASSAQWSGGTGVFVDVNSLNTIYTPSVDDINSGSVTLTLTTDDPVGPCPANTSDIIITINPGVIVEAGPDEAICSDDVFTTQGSVGGSASSGEWNTSGSGLFVNFTDLVTDYVPSASDIAGGSVILTLSTDDPGGPCSQSSSSMTLSFSAAATLSVPANLESCIGTSVALSASIGGSATGVSWSSGGGSFAPNVNDLTPDYIPTNAENVANQAIVTAEVVDPDGSGPCLSLSENILINLLDTVQVNAGADDVVCSNDTYIMSGSIGGSASSASWVTSGTGSFDDDMDLNATYTPSAGDLLAGVVVLTLTSDNPTGPCNESSSSMTLNFSDVATLSVPANLESCVGATVSLSASIGGSALGVIWSSTGGGSFAPTVNDLNPVYTPTNAENIANEAVVTASVADPDGSGPCLSLAQNILINLLDTAEVSAGLDAVICSNDLFVTQGIIGGSASTALWTSNGTGSFDDNTNLNATYTPSGDDLLAGTVVLTITSDNPTGPCESSFDDMVLTFSSAATIDIPFPSSGTCDNSAVPVTASLGGSATSLTWSGGSGTYTPNAFSPNIDYAPSATEIAAGSLVLTVTTDDPDGSGPCLVATDNVTINISTDVNVDAGDDQEACSDEPIVLNGSFGGAASSAEWTGGLGTFFPNNLQLNAQYTPTATEIANGSVTLTLTTDDPIGPCVSVADQITYTFTFPATVVAGADEVVCSNSAIALSGSIGGTASTATWTTNGSGTFNNALSLGAVYTPSAGDLSLGSVVLTLTTDDPSGACFAEQSTLNLTINEGASISVTTPLIECIGDQFALNAVIDGAASNLTWSSGSGIFTPNANSPTASYLPSLTENAAGILALDVTTDDPDGGGPCLAATEVVILQIDSEANVSAGLDDVVCSNSIFELNGSIGGIASSATWASSGTGTFGNVNNLTSEYTPSAGDMTAGVVVLSLTTDNPAGVCPAVVSTMNLTINEGAFISVTSPLTECIGNEFELNAVIDGAASSLTWSSGTGSFTPNANSATASYLPSVSENATGFMSLDVTTDDPDGTGPCLAATEAVILQIDAEATVSAGSNDVVCSDATIELNGSIGGIASSATWTSSGTGTFDNVNNLSSDYTPSVADMTAGVVVLSLTTDDPLGACPEVISSMELTVNEAVTLSVVSPLIACVNEEIPLESIIGGSATSVTWSGGSGTFTPNANDLTPDYLPSSTENTTGGLTLEIETNDPDGAGPCLSASDEVVIQINELPTVFAGNAMDICSNNQVPLNGTFGGSASSVTWTSSGAGVFDDAASLIAVYTPDAADLISGSVILTLTTDDPFGPCVAASSDVTITFIEIPTVTAGLNQDVCSDALVALSGIIGGSATQGTWTSSGSGTFIPNNLDLNGQYSPSSGDITAGSVVLTLTTDDPSGVCGLVSSEMTINLFDFAVADAGIDQSICSAENALLGGSIGGSAVSITWTTDGDGVFTPNTSALNATYVPGINDQNSGFVTLTMTTNDPVGPCDAAISSLNISISGVAEVDAGSDFTVCGGADAALNGSITGAVITGFWSGGAGTFSDILDLNASYTPTAAELSLGSVVLTLTSDDPVGPCGPEFADVTVSFTSSAIVSAGTAQTICEGDDVNLDGAIGGSAVTGTWSGGSGIFIPNATSLNAVYIPSALENATGSVLLTLTTNNPAGPCAAVSEDILITINPTPVLSSVSEIDVCSGVPVNYAITSNVSATFVWNAQSDEPLVNGESLTVVASSVIDDVLDNTSSSIQTLTYLVSATALSSGCTNDNQVVDVNVNPVVSMDTPDSEVLCVGENTTSVLFSSSFTGLNFSWTNNNAQIGLGLSGDSDILSFTAINTTAIIQTGIITVTPAINGCPGTPVNFEITVNPSSTVNDPGAIVECDGAPTADISFSGSDPSIIYSWTNTNTDIGLPVAGTGDILSFVATNLTNDPIQATIEVTPELNGCDGSAQTFTIDVNPSPEMDIPSDQTICVTNNSVPVIFSSNVLGTSYAWTNDNLNIGLGINGSGDILSFTTINSGNILDTANITVVPTFNGCDGVPIEFDFIVTPLLGVDFIADTILCAGEEFPGVNFSGNVPGLSYEWTNNNISIGLPSNGTGDISSFIVTNSGVVDQSATITVTPILVGCTSIDSEFTITVKPVPTVSVVPLSQTLCHDEATIPVDFSGNITSAVYNWSHDDISIGIGTPGFADIPPFIATNTSLVSETSTFIVTPSFNGCVGAPENFTITVNPKPSVFPIPSQVLCAGFPTAAIDFDGDFGDLATYTWTNDNILIGLPADGFDDISSFIVDNTTSDVQTATITVTPSINGCEGLPQVFTITVKPTPTLVGPIPNQSLCVNTDSDPVVFTGNLPAVTNYNWVNDNVAIGLVAAGIGDIPIFTAQNTGNTVIISTITVTPELDGCIGLPQVFTITTVDPVPVVFDPLDQIVCSGLPTNTVNFNGPNPTTSFIWTNNNSSIGLAADGTGDIISFISDNTSFVDQIATITVEPEFNGCFGELQEFTITVKPTPVVVIAPSDQELCSGQTTDEIDFSGDLVGTTYDWVNDNISINLNASGGGNVPEFIVENVSSTAQVATISVTPTFNGCVGLTEDALITVNPISTVVIAPGVDEYCHNESTNSYIFNGSNPSTQYNWTNDNTSIGLPASGVGNILSFPVTNTDLVNQLATITVQPELNGCDGTAQIVQIIVKPIPTVDQVPDQNICANEDSQAINFDGNLPDSTEYNWTHDNVSIGLGSNGIGNIPSFPGTNTSQDIEIGNITVIPILNGCIGAAMTTSITVNPISIVNTINDTVCSGETVPQIDFAGSNSAALYSWANDNSSVGLANNGTDFIPSFVSENLGTTNQTATIIVTPSVNGCDGINDTMVILVYPLPVVDPIGDDIYCAEDLSNLISFTGNMPINEYNWSNDNAAIGLAGSDVGDISPFITTNTGTGDLVGTIVVTPSANECIGAQETFTITVHPLPDVEAGMDTTLCFEQSITLTAAGANNYAWDNGVLNGVEFFPSSTIMYTVVGTDTNLCQNTDSILVTYTLDLPPVVNAGPDTAICLGEQISLTATGDAVLYLWDNGVIDGEVFEPSVTNDYTVIATAANGCVESDTVEVVVNPLPIITASASDDFICDGESTVLWGEGADTYVWDQSVIDSVAFVPGATSTYTVVGFDINGCTDTTDIQVIVNPLPDALFSTDMTYGGCLPFEPTFTDLTSGPSSNSVQWYFGNGASSTQMGSVLNTYDSYGCYDVTLVSTTAEGCTDSLTQQDFVCVNEVNAEFLPDVYQQSVVNPIFEFTNSSTNATTFEWFFGDGYESDFVNTTHFYESYGNYVVSLVATAQDGCTDTAYVAITVIDEVLFYVPNSFTPNGDGKNELFTPVLTAGYDRERGYEFRIYNRWGEEVFYTDTPGVGWDGTYLNTAVQNGTYVWYVKFKDSMNNEIYDHSGHVNVIK
jgi:gliding motility-associated-like protein